MSEEIQPPNIWKYDECDAVNTDGVNMKEFKPIGQFYHDANMLCGLYGIKPHPIFREPPPPPQPAPENGEAVGAFEE